MTSIMKPLLEDLAEQCRADPTRAVCEMRAVCDSDPGDPLKWTVTGTPGSRRETAVGSHPLLGGDGSAPCPGELVAMALAACTDGTLRQLADLMDIELDRVRVEVVNRGDARPLIGAQDVAAPADTGLSMTVEIEARGATADQLAKLRHVAESAPGVLDMLRRPVDVDVTWS